MTGTLLLDPGPDPPYNRVWFELGDHRLAFTDPRRFGTGELALGGDALDAFFAARLGVEPLGDGFTADHLYGLARASRAPIKAFLLDQKRVAGVGNIYADEALFRARVHPLRPANRLTRAQCAAIRDAVVETLEAGIASKGATIDDFRDPDGVSGAFQDRFLIHLREGLAVLELRPPGAQAPRRRPRHLRVRALPAPPAARQVTLARLVGRLGGGFGEVREAPLAVGEHQLLVAADRLVVDDDLGERHHPRETHQLRAALRVLGEVDLGVGDVALREQGLGYAAVAAGLGGIDGDPTHYFT